MIYAGDATFAGELLVNNKRTNLRLDSTQTAPNKLSTVLMIKGYVGSTGTAYSGIGFNYNSSGDVQPPAWIGIQGMSNAGHSKADIVFATRSVTTDTAPTERMRISTDGNATFAGNVKLTGKLQIGDNVYNDSTSFVGLAHINQTGASNTDYMIMSADADTYISASTGCDVHIRGGGGVQTYELRVYPDAHPTASGNLILTSANYSSYANFGSTALTAGNGTFSGKNLIKYGGSRTYSANSSPHPDQQFLELQNDSSANTYYTSQKFTVGDGLTESNGYITYVKTGNYTGKFIFNYRTGLSTHVDTLQLKANKATFSGSVKTGDTFIASNGDEGITTTKQWIDVDDQIHIVTISDGLITDWTVSDI